MASPFISSQAHAPTRPMPFRRAASAYAGPLSDPLTELSDDVTARFALTAQGKPTGAIIGRDMGRSPARRASFRTPPR